MTNLKNLGCTNRDVAPIIYGTFLVTYKSIAIALE